MPSGMKVEVNSGPLLGPMAARDGVGFRATGGVTAISKPAPGLTGRCSGLGSCSSLIDTRLDECSGFESGRRRVIEGRVKADSIVEGEVA
jgi:hypothetical protein